LRTADEHCLLDGAAFLLPGHIAATLSVAELDGFLPVLRAAYDLAMDEVDTHGARRRLAVLYGTIIGRLTGELPPHVLSPRDPLGRYTRRRLGAALDDPRAAAVLGHAIPRSTLSRG
jgi:hypothetical protein